MKKQIDILADFMANQVEARVRELELLLENQRLREAIRWALGETDFEDRQEGEGAYWWRKKLRRLAGAASRRQSDG